LVARAERHATATSILELRHRHFSCGRAIFHAALGFVCPPWHAFLTGVLFLQLFAPSHLLP
jgi:hypothetical protein